MRQSSIKSLWWLAPVGILAAMSDVWAQHHGISTSVYGDWDLWCESQAGPSPLELCDISQMTLIEGQPNSVLRIEIRRPERGQPIRLIAHLPTDISSAVSVRIELGDKGFAIARSDWRCGPIACIAEFEVQDDVLDTVRADTGPGNIVFTGAARREVVIPVSFKGFQAAFAAMTRR